MTEEREIELAAKNDEEDDLNIAELAALQRMHPHPFKLRFSASRELGRSRLQPRLPLILPDIVTGKFYSRWECEEIERDEAAAANTRVDDGKVCRRSPKDIYKEPLLSSHVYGWHWQHGAKWNHECRKDPRLWHGISDSPALKASAILLHHDNKLKGK